MGDIAYVKWVSIVLIFLVALVSGAYPFFKKWTCKAIKNMTGEALASGIFLGAGLIHLLPDAMSDFSQMHFDYPIAVLLAGVTFVFFLAIEHLGREINTESGNTSKKFAVIAFFMLSIHSFFAGSALGLSHNSSMALLILIAILAHKWAASFALALQINKSHFSFGKGLLLFGIFCCMTPLGILFGQNILSHAVSSHALEATFNAIAAGTFIYLGTLHGLARSFMVKECCNLKNFSFVVCGFSVMALLAVWL